MEDNLENFQQIKAIIDRWDPVDLGWFPDDEYTVEIKQIIEAYHEIGDNVEGLGDAIEEVLVRNFGRNVFIKDILECRQIAEKIILL